MASRGLSEGALRKWYGANARKATLFELPSGSEFGAFSEWSAIFSERALAPDLFCILFSVKRKKYDRR